MKASKSKVTKGKNLGWVLGLEVWPWSSRSQRGFRQQIGGSWRQQMGRRVAADRERLDAQPQIAGTGWSSERQQHIVALEVECVWPLLAMVVGSQQITTLLCVSVLWVLYFCLCCESVLL